KSQETRTDKVEILAEPPPAAAVVPPKQPEIQKEIVPVSNQNPYTETAVPELLAKNAAPTPAKEIPAPSATVIATPPTPVATVVNGTLAVSSPTSTEIYLGEKYLGSTPTTLDLAAGTYALEYRHGDRSEEHTSELQSRGHLVCRLLLEKKKNKKIIQ